MAPSHVLVPLDGSPLAEAALAHALETFDVEVTVLNVVTPVDATMSESGVIEGESGREATAHARAEAVIEDATRRASEAGRTVETAVQTGDPAETIIEYVAAHDVDHVVMGGHGNDRHEVTARLLGTVATRVVTETPVTVTVVR